MSQFRISTQAAQDIENIWNYIAQNNLKAADNLFDNQILIIILFILKSRKS
ncbi:type II toxin-antitoxin system RelE/ParE family toxin [Cylindrospermum sp. FACHB-282]|uniref:type II toxin-antitoxin system RelE/ParE family toxin n=1 Tax=Cylindrospermum sp. FACHB-282 TaxID=2692794 RepID=UPI001688A8FB|nr:type II toxin-antitoxin system RelE/ParE family toxin [Cylindrospermum sp. FACHB-282]MBD2386386.1 type II toxin-antitoxin system RelE/ParE family toxin [Cylindrospermum sp. FACHB-282]